MKKLNPIVKEFVESKKFFDWIAVEELRVGDIVPNNGLYYGDEENSTEHTFRLLMLERMVVIGTKEEEGMVTIWVTDENNLDHNGRCDFPLVGHFYKPVGDLWARYADEKDDRVKV